MKPNELFRPEAVRAVKTDYLGKVVLMRPISLKIISIISLVLIGVVVLFVFLGSYTKRTKIMGQLIPSDGLIKIIAPQSGIVIERHVSEGDVVRSGNPLFTLSSERISHGLGKTQDMVIKQLMSRKESLNLEIGATEIFQKNEIISLNGKIQQLENTVVDLKYQYKVQGERVGISQDIVDRYENLLEKRYISKDQFLEKKMDLLDQETRLKGVKRELDSTLEELVSKKIELKTLPQKQISNSAQIKRALFSVEQELSEAEAKRSIVIVAPQDGVVTGVLAQEGQTVEPVMPLLSIVPSNSSLIANLYAPSKTIGFIKPGSSVLLRYEAYPYQKFGQYEGVISSISETALSIQELSLLSGGKIPISDITANEELYYQIVVNLNSQFAIAYGISEKLKAGMVLEASIRQERRKIYEWILDPLYGLKINIQSS